MVMAVFLCGGMFCDGSAWGADAEAMRPLRRGVYPPKG